MTTSNFWDHRLTAKENIARLLKKYIYFVLGIPLLLLPLLYRLSPSQEQDIRFLLVYLPIIGSIFIILGCLGLWTQDKANNHPVKLVFHGLWVLLILYFASLAMTTTSLLSETKRNPLMSGQDIIVLGAELSADSDRRILNHLLEPVAGYLKQYPEAKAILTGGIYERASQSTAIYMADYLATAGISQDRLYLADGSADTKQAIQEAKALVKDLQGGSQQATVGLVGHEYQLHRGRLYAKREDLAIAKMCVITPSDDFLSANYFIREHPKVLLAWIGK